MSDKRGFGRQWLDRLITPDIEQLTAKANKPLGTYGYDPWGYNDQAVKLGIAVTRVLYERYFRVQAHGLEHIPASGRLLVIANHSGQLPMDGLLTGYALATNPHAPRMARAMIERFFPTVPYVGNLLNSFGGVIGDPVNCSRMLEREEAIIVYPEGVRGSGKLYRDRYKLQRFGNGFMHLAIKHKVPIVPLGIVGCEETMPALANIKPLASLLAVPYVPLAFPIPLPARVFLNFGEPMFFDGDLESEEDVTVRVEQVKTAIRELIGTGLQQRQNRVY
jgi:1-acyl-sn-glycerol-3-phosphate acyltransferase